jgi:CBS domain-containing protein
MCFPQELAAANVLSAPVVTPDTNEYAGILDVVDILAGLLSEDYGLNATHKELLRSGGKWLAHHSRLGITELTAFGADFGNQPVGHLMHGGEVWFKGDASASLLRVIKEGFMICVPSRVHASNKHHMRVHHRIAVFEILPGEQTPDGPIPEWRITDVFSQTDVVRFLAAHRERLGESDPGMKASLTELGLVPGHVVTVDASFPALAALDAMQKNHVSGIGVVSTSSSPSSPAGSLLANLSVSDLRGISPLRLGALALPLGTFLLVQRGEISWEDAVGGHVPEAVKEGRWEEVLDGVKSSLVQCSPETSLEEAIRMLVEGGKHRLYVVEANGRAVGVVTPTDVLRAIVAPEKLPREMLPEKNVGAGQGGELETEKEVMCRCCLPY